MTNALQTQQQSAIEQVVIQGDLSQLTAGQRVDYYRQVCNSVGLNPFTKPFDYIKLNGKLTLYAKKDATDQLRSLRGVSIGKPDIEYLDDLVVVTVTAQDASGRTDSDLGAVTIGNLKGDARANAMMKAITKAKRRVTLSICGLGWLDETELETIPSAQPVDVDTETGEIVDAPTPQPNGNGKSTSRPMPPQALQGYLRKVASEGLDKVGTQADAQQTASTLTKMVGEDFRHMFLDWLFGVKSTKELTVGQHAAIRRWAGWRKDDNDEWHLNDDTVKEAASALRQAQLDAGQGDLFEEVNAELFPQ